MEPFAVVAPFLRSGLKRGERCLYVANDTSVALVLQKLSRSGIDVLSAQQKGRPHRFNGRDRLSQKR